ncbi:hypothetical protein BV25DRAFT_1837151 [Artomyces pyxidatus]|uniref:Uncharacterized protein n=1 Tax=Artomyces pyxidatus TaxID=48021 RepID=A0ACB8T741_9AGAM|nr:hypothetical protein BV25DRAFT_1837151 [Artomyces pyxidatus]
MPAMHPLVTNGDLHPSQPYAHTELRLGAGTASSKGAGCSTGSSPVNFALSSLIFDLSRCQSVSLLFHDRGKLYPVLAAADVNLVIMDSTCARSLVKRQDLETESNGAYAALRDLSIHHLLTTEGMESIADECERLERLVISIAVSKIDEFVSSLASSITLHALIDYHNDGMDRACR